MLQEKTFISGLYIRESSPQGQREWESSLFFVFSTLVPGNPMAVLAGLGRGSWAGNQNSDGKEPFLLTRETVTLRMGGNTPILFLSLYSPTA